MESNPVDLSALTEETKVFYEGDTIQHAMSLMQAALPSAVRTIVDLCQNSESEMRRYQAATFIVNHALPKADPKNQTKDSESALALLLGQVVHEIPQAADTDLT